MVKLQKNSVLSLRTSVNEENTHKLRTACIDMNKAGTLNVSKNISAAFSRFLLGFKGASVSNTGCWRYWTTNRKLDNYWNLILKRSIISSAYPLVAMKTHFYHVIIFGFISLFHVAYFISHQNNIGLSCIKLLLHASY